MLFYDTKINEPPPENHTRITEINTRITVLRKAVRSLQKYPETAIQPFIGNNHMKRNAFSSFFSLLWPNSETSPETIGKIQRKAQKHEQYFGDKPAPNGKRLQTTAF